MLVCTPCSTQELRSFFGVLYHYINPIKWYYKNVIILNPINITKSQYVSNCLPTIDHLDPPWYATEARVSWPLMKVVGRGSGRVMPKRQRSQTRPHWAVDPGLSALMKNPSWTAMNNDLKITYVTRVNPENGDFTQNEDWMGFIVPFFFLHRVGVDWMEA